MCWTCLDNQDGRLFVIALHRSEGKDLKQFIGAYSLGMVLVYYVFLSVPNFLTALSKHCQAIGGNIATSFLKDWICELVKNSQAYFTGSKLMHREIN